MPDPRLLRISYFSPAWPPSSRPNGIVTYVANLRTGMLQLGHEVRIVAGELRSADPDRSVAIDASTARRHDRPVRRAADRLIGLVNGDVAVVAHRTARAISGALTRLGESWPVDLFEIEESFGLAALLSRPRPFPVSVRLHGPWPLTAPAMGFPRDRAFARRCRYERRAVLAADCVTAPSHDVLRRALDAWDIDIPVSAVVPNPAPAVPEERRWARSEVDPDLVLFVGRFDRIKGGDLVIDSFAATAHRRPRIRLAFVGPDDGLRDVCGHAQSLDSYLEQNVPDRGIRGRVQFLGPLDPEAVARLRRSAAVTVVASRQESFSMTALEAMSHGCPLIAPDIGAIREIVEPSETAILFRAGDANHLAQQLEHVLSAPERAADMGARAARVAAERFSSVSVARRMADLYREVRDRFSLSSTTRTRAYGIF